MAIKIYVASRTKHAEMWRGMRAHGVPIVSTWIDEAGPGETASMAELWLRILEEVKNSDGLILYMEPDDVPLKGAFVEVGVALGRGLPVCVVAPGCIMSVIGSWFNHPNVMMAHSRRDAYSKLLAWYGWDNEAVRVLRNER